jgi:hypothetical protein
MEGLTNMYKQIVNKKPFVTRILRNKNNNKKVKVNIYQPVQEGDDWVCIVCIGDRMEKVYGIDPMQSIILSFDTIRSILESMGNELYWLDDLEFLGFPLFVPMYLPDKERNQIEKILDKETKKLLPIKE